METSFEKYIEDTFTDAHRKGFYTCEYCKGIEPEICPICHGSGLLQDSKVLYMHILSECVEAREADGIGRKIIDKGIQKTIQWLACYYGIQTYEVHYARELKGTLEEELADIAIIIFSLCGYKGMELHRKSLHKIAYADPTPEIRTQLINSCLLDISYAVCNSFYLPHEAHNQLIHALSILYSLAEALLIPLDAHIELKIRYNKTRGYLHEGESVCQN